MVVADRLRLLAHAYAGRAALCVMSVALAACNEQNAYVPPPPPKVDVALPLKQDVTPYLEATGNTVAINDTALIARVEGFIQEIDYKDGDSVKAGAVLFVIEPEPYQLALAQAHLRVAGAADVDHVLPALADDLARLREAERAEELGVEGEAALEVGDDEVEMVDAGHGPILAAP